MLDYRGQKRRPNMNDFVQLDKELEVLESFMPVALREGALLVEFKSDNEVTPAAILTLNEQETIGSKPDENVTDAGTWCFNLRQQCWVWLDYAKIDAVQPWPILDESISNP